MKKATWTERADDAANFLTETDAKLARLHQAHETSKRKAKRIWSAIFKRVEGNIEERKAQAEIHTDYLVAVDDELEALLTFEILRNQRDTADTVIDFWRSWNKAKTDGVI
jgi:hypothetical protein